MPQHNPDRQFWQIARQLKDYPLREKLHGQFYMRFPYLYIATGTRSNGLGRFGARVIAAFNRLFPPRAPKPGAITFADTYHGKVVPLATARELVSVKENISVPDLEHVIPYKLARALILDHPDHLAVLDCPCRVAREHPCLPLDVCLIVGEPFASFVTEHNPDRSRRIDGDEAARILQEEHDRGHVHHAFFKDAMLGRFYAICNCCECCCGAMQAHFNGVPMLASSGYVCNADADLCIGCGECVSSCQFHALSLIDGVTQIDWNACMGCGVCVDKCVQGALALARDERKGMPLEMRALLAEV